MELKVPRCHQTQVDKVCGMHHDNFKAANTFFRQRWNVLRSATIVALTFETGKASTQDN